MDRHLDTLFATRSTMWSRACWRCSPTRRPKGGRAREQDSLLREELLGAFMEGRRLLQARGRFKHEGLEPPTLLGAEVTETSVARDPLLVLGDRLTSPSVLLNESRVDPELHARE